MPVGSAGNNRERRDGKTVRKPRRAGVSMGQEPRRAHARGIACCVRLAAAGLMAALVAGCMTSAPTASSGNASTPTIAFESIDGPPVVVFERLVQTMSSEAQARQMAIVSREGAAQYRVRGYLAAQVERGRTHISWVWDVYDAERRRAFRISGDEAGGRGGRDPWGVADDRLLQKIARASMDQLATFLAAPEPGPAAPVVAVALVR
jgi:hypothetical protein